MLYRSIILAAAFAAAAAFPSHLAPHGLHGAKLSKREARVRELQSANPTATAEACAACVGAEETLIAAIDVHDKAAQAEADAAKRTAAAAEAHDAATTKLSEDATALANAELAAQGLVTNKTPEGLCAASETWSAAIKAHGASVEAEALALSALNEAKEAEKAAEDTLAGHVTEVATARSGADAACATMRTAGYGYVAATTAPIVATTAKPSCPAPVDGTCVDGGQHNGPHPVTVCDGGLYITQHTIESDRKPVENLAKYACTGKANGGWGVHQATEHDCTATSPEGATRTHMWAPNGHTYSCFFGCTLCEPAK